MMVTFSFSFPSNSLGDWEIVNSPGGTFGSMMGYEERYVVGRTFKEKMLLFKGWMLTTSPE